MKTIKLVMLKKGQGFTFIEIMVTLVIMGILASVALPSFTSFIAAQRIKSASFDLMSLMIFARSEAIKRNANVTLNFDPLANAYTVTAGGTILRQQAAFTGFLLNCKTSAGSAGAVTACPASGIVYLNSGRLASAFLPIELSNAAATSATSSRCITIDLSGRPMSKKGGC